jgi:hypothetical protein
LHFRGVYASAGAGAHHPIVGAVGLAGVAEGPLVVAATGADRVADHRACHLLVAAAGSASAGTATAIAGAPITRATVTGASAAGPAVTTALALADHAEAFGAGRAGIAERAALTATLAADRLVDHRACGLLLGRSLPAALALSDDAEAVGARHAGIAEGLAFAAALDRRLAGKERPVPDLLSRCRTGAFARLG